MAVPSNLTSTQIVTEALKWGGRTVPTSAQITAALQAVVATRPGSLRSCVMLTDGVRQPNCTGFTSGFSGSVSLFGGVVMQ